MCDCENLLVLGDLKYDKYADGQVLASQTHAQRPRETDPVLLSQACAVCSSKVSGSHLIILEWST